MLVFGIPIVAASASWVTGAVKHALGSPLQQQYSTCRSDPAPQSGPQHGVINSKQLPWFALCCSSLPQFFLLQSLPLSLSTSSKRGEFSGLWCSWLWGTQPTALTKTQGFIFKLLIHNLPNIWSCLVLVLDTSFLFLPAGDHKLQLLFPPWPLYFPGLAFKSCQQT